MTPRYPDQLDHLLDQILRDHYAAVPRPGLEYQISAALHDRAVSRNRPIWRRGPLIFAEVAACCVAVMITTLSLHRTTREPAAHQESHRSYPPKSSSAAPPRQIEVTTRRNELHATAVARSHSPSGSKPLPKLPAFPSSSGLTPGERQLLALSLRPSSPPPAITVEDLVTIAAVEIKPIQIPLIAPQPVP
jgi:hypothetical protein